MQVSAVQTDSLIDIDSINYCDTIFFRAVSGLLGSILWPDLRKGTLFGV